jgi:hypothetical protein
MIQPSASRLGWHATRRSDVQHRLREPSARKADDDLPKVRGRKDQGLLLCWNCHNDEKARNRGCYSLATEDLIDDAERRARNAENQLREIQTKIGDWVVANYRCEFDPQTSAVISATLNLGKLPQNLAK